MSDALKQRIYEEDRSRTEEKPPFTAVAEELQRAKIWPPFNSLHEAYGVLMEEVDEFWAHVKVNQKKRDLPACRAELVQLAAMAIKGIECIDAGRGRV